MTKPKAKKPRRKATKAAQTSDVRIAILDAFLGSGGAAYLVKAGEKDPAVFDAFPGGKAARSAPEFDIRAEARKYAAAAIRELVRMSESKDEATRKVAQAVLHQHRHTIQKLGK